MSRHLLHPSASDHHIQVWPCCLSLEVHALGFSFVSVLSPTYVLSPVSVLSPAYVLILGSVLSAAIVPSSAFVPSAVSVPSPDSSPVPILSQSLHGQIIMPSQTQVETQSFNSNNVEDEDSSDSLTSQFMCDDEEDSRSSP